MEEIRIWYRVKIFELLSIKCWKQSTKWSKIRSLWFKTDQIFKNFV